MTKDNKIFGIIRTTTISKEMMDLILEYVKEHATDILGYVPNDNDINGVGLNILVDIQDRIVEFTDFMETEYQTGGNNNEIQ